MNFMKKNEMIDFRQAWSSRQPRDFSTKITLVFHSYYHRLLLSTKRAVSTKGVLCCLYLIVNFQVKIQVPLWGKYHKRKVITHLKQVSNFRVTIVVTKIIFKLFLSAFCISLFQPSIKENKNFHIVIYICILILNKDQSFSFKVVYVI